MMPIDQVSLVELKAIAYELAKQMNDTQNKMNIVEDLIARKTQEEAKKAQEAKEGVGEKAVAGPGNTGEANTAKAEPKAKAKKK